MSQYFEMKYCLDWNLEALVQLIEENKASIHLASEALQSKYVVSLIRHLKNVGEFSSAEWNREGKT